MSRQRPKTYVSWSSGKDSAFAFYEARRAAELDLVGVLTTVNEVYDRVAMHGVRASLLERQFAALGVSAVKIPIPSPCPNDIYEARMRTAVEAIKLEGVDHVVFGDLFLEDIRAYREEKMAAAGLAPVFPLWGRDTAALARDMIASGLVAYLVCVDPRKLDPSFAGRRFDLDLLRDLPSDVDPCGERGEFHTVVVDGPMFTRSIPVRIGEVVTRDGFVFADVAPL